MASHSYISVTNPVIPCVSSTAVPLPFEQHSTQVVHGKQYTSPEDLLDHLTQFNKHVEHIATIKTILTHTLGLSNEDADVFIRSGVDAVFGKFPAKTPVSPTCVPCLPAMAGPDNKLHIPEAASGIWMNELR